MTTFLSLADSPTRLLNHEGPDGAFLELVQQKSLALAQPGRRKSPADRRLVIGVGTWNRPELELLDQLAASPPASVQVELFDASSCRTENEYEAYIPGIAPVHQTPLVGYWAHNQKVDVAQGSAGLDLIRQVIGRPTVSPPATSASSLPVP